MRTRTDLRNRWIALSDNASIYDNTIAPRYSEIHRHYHTLDHVEACLAVLDDAKGLDDPYDREVAEYAIWFHDVVYDSRRDDNEISSVGVWLHAARNIKKLDRGDWIDVTECILRTIHDNTEHEYDKLLSYVVDIDLSILGAPNLIFDKYENDIRKEYSHFGNDAYVRGRVNVLQGFLSREHIYETQEFQNKYEYRARSNLKRSLEKLTGVQRASAV
jgi:predicted metal-dependent HD superfamily phosphohydrolase